MLNFHLTSLPLIAAICSLLVHHNSQQTQLSEPKHQQLWEYWLLYPHHLHPLMLHNRWPQHDSIFPLLERRYQQSRGLTVIMMLIMMIKTMITIMITKAISTTASSHRNVYNLNPRQINQVHNTPIHSIPHSICPQLYFCSYLTPSTSQYTYTTLNIPTPPNVTKACNNPPPTLPRQPPTNVYHW